MHLYFYTRIAQAWSGKMAQSAVKLHLRSTLFDLLLDMEVCLFYLHREHTSYPLTSGSSIYLKLLREIHKAVGTPSPLRVSFSSSPSYSRMTLQAQTTVPPLGMTLGPLYIGSTIAAMYVSYVPIFLLNYTPLPITVSSE